jgi:uncharacterized membrane protein YqgA involved in biofilm formation
MLPALISGVIGTLLQNNMPKVAQAVVDKGLDYVSDKLGVELKPDMTPQEVEAARQSAMKHEEFMVEQHVKNTADARDMQKVALQQDDKFSKRFVMYLTIFWSIAATTYIGFVTFGTIPENNVRFADTILGFLLGTVVATMLNFWLGSSIGSKEKDIKK